MVEGRETAAWDRASLLLALTANAHRNPEKTAPFKAWDFHPYRASKRNKKRRPSVERFADRVMKIAQVRGGKKAARPREESP